MNKLFHASLALLTVYTFSFCIALGCTSPKKPTPDQAAAVAEGLCVVMRAFADSDLEEAICASADVLLEIAANIRTQRADAGPAKSMKASKSGQCQMIPQQSLCASDEELASAIRYVRAYVKPATP
jgi:hypothetical protein